MKKDARKRCTKRQAKPAKKTITEIAKPVVSAEIKKAEVSAPAVLDMVQIDYPKNNEEISIGTGYTVRISATECAAVEISVNDGEWKPCRNASGYWWFDWDETEAGKYKLYARMVKSSGEIIVSKRRLCKIS